MAQNAGNAKNILVGASPLFISNLDVTSGTSYVENAEPGTTAAGHPYQENPIQIHLMLLHQALHLHIAT